MTAPIDDGAVNVPADQVAEQAKPWGFDSAGINDNAQATDNATIDRHII